MLKFLATTAIALSASQAGAEEYVCNDFYARDYPSIRVSLGEKTVTVQWDRYKETYEVAITKNFGVLMESAIVSKRELIPYARTRVDGAEALIFNAMVFFHNCEDPH